MEQTPCLQNLLNRWDAVEALPAIEPGWEESAREASAACLPSPLEIGESLALCGMDPSLEAPLLEIREAFAASREWTVFFHHTCRQAFLSGEPFSLAAWPELTTAFGDRCRLPYLLAALASVPAARRKHRELGIPEEVTRATCRDIAIKEERSRMVRPQWRGLAPRELGWLRHHVHGTAFTLGRLQFLPTPWRGGLTVFTDRSRSRFLAFLPDGESVTEDGFALPADGDLPAGKKPWLTTRFRRHEEWIEGHPVGPEGRPRRQIQRVPAAEWTPLLEPGRKVLEIHIPAGGRLDLEACRDSLTRAAAFFPRHFPEPAPQVFTCVTWFLGPQMETLLAPDSNIRRFQRAGHRFPVRSTGKDGFIFIFSQSTLPEHPPPGNKLAALVHRHVTAGGAWGLGGFFFPVERASQFGAPWENLVSPADNFPSW